MLQLLRAPAPGLAGPCSVLALVWFASRSYLCACAHANWIKSGGLSCAHANWINSGGLYMVHGVPLCDNGTAEILRSIFCAHADQSGIWCLSACSARVRDEPSALVCCFMCLPRFGARAWTVQGLSCWYIVLDAGWAGFSIAWALYTPPGKSVRLARVTGLLSFPCKAM